MLLVGVAGCGAMAQDTTNEAVMSSGVGREPATGKKIE